VLDGTLEYSLSSKADLCSVIQEIPRRLCVAAPLPSPSDPTTGPRPETGTHRRRHYYTPNSLTILRLTATLVVVPHC
jgi:hypothetical protein